MAGSQDQPHTVTQICKMSYYELNGYLSTPDYPEFHWI